MDLSAAIEKLARLFSAAGGAETKAHTIELPKQRQTLLVDADGKQKFLDWRAEVCGLGGSLSTIAPMLDRMTDPTVYVGPEHLTLADHDPDDRHAIQVRLSLSPLYKLLQKCHGALHTGPDENRGGLLLNHAGLVDFVREWGTDFASGDEFAALVASATFTTTSESSQDLRPSRANYGGSVVESVRAAETPDIELERTLEFSGPLWNDPTLALKHFICRVLFIPRPGWRQFQLLVTQMEMAQLVTNAGSYLYESVLEAVNDCTAHEAVPVVVGQAHVEDVDEDA